MGIKFVGKKEAKLKLKELGLGLKRAFKTKRIDGDIFQFTFASPARERATNIADDINKVTGRRALVIKSGDVFEVYQFWGAKGKPKPLQQQVLIHTRDKSPRITPKTPRLRR